VSSLPFRRALALPASLAIKEAEFKDLDRNIYSDPVIHPGNTWSPLFVRRNGKAAALDRIVRLSWKSAKRLEDEEGPVLRRNFPSAHAAVLLEFECPPEPGLKGEAKK